MRFVLAGIVAGWLLMLSGVALADPSAAALDAAGVWGDRACDTGLNFPPRDAFITRPFDDRFRVALAASGRYLPTAGKGSAWVYDPSHHILAESEGGDVSGSSIFFCAARPPIALPVRHLARVVSVHGLSLGQPLARALAILGVPKSSLKVIGPGRSIVVVRKPRKCGAYACAHDNTVVFKGGRVIAIALDDIGP
jgi:hypothetical protein